MMPEENLTLAMENNLLKAELAELQHQLKTNNEEEKQKEKEKENNFVRI